MSEEKKVTKYDHNYKNRSPMEELAELVSKNTYLKDALTIAVKTIAKFSQSGHAVSSSLNKLNDAKNNWDRSKHADVAIRQADKLNRDLQPFRAVISTLRYKEDMYGYPNKTHTLKLGSTHGNFGMHYANNNKE